MYSQGPPAQLVSQPAPTQAAPQPAQAPVSVTVEPFATHLQTNLTPELRNSIQQLVRNLGTTLSDSTTGNQADRRRNVTSSLERVHAACDQVDTTLSCLANVSQSTMCLSKAYSMAAQMPRFELQDQAEFLANARLQVHYADVTKQVFGEFVDNLGQLLDGKKESTEATTESTVPVAHGSDEAAAVELKLEETMQL